MALAAPGSLGKAHARPAPASVVASSPEQALTRRWAVVCQFHATITAAVIPGCQPLLEKTPKQPGHLLFPGQARYGVVCRTGTSKQSAAAFAPIRQSTGVKSVVFFCYRIQTPDEAHVPYLPAEDLITDLAAWPSTWNHLPNPR